ncbi:TauD/TfdA family dioxygenase [Frankia sp. CiP3]|uniref:TauD/TfdA dioxygenase family protein n=1 Tax=Frankia sp. CiP3 TaxID=2880971 RepID=UPI001EF456B5|nr:TauD/TfdA family dioxygenase [Frankia sp. CiP3]
MTTTLTALDGRQLTGNIGAEISGLRLSGDLPDDVIAAIRANLLAHKVLFFRGQDHLDDDEQVAFARRLGPITQGHPNVAPDSEVFDLDYSRSVERANVWHTDVTFVVQPPSFSVLRGLRIPDVGGDTIWANTASAYTALRPELRELADQLWTLHTNDFDYAESHERIERLRNLDPSRFGNGFLPTIYKTRHPLVRVHPETGERSLLLGGFARGFIGFSSSTFEALKKIFQEEITRAENTVRWKWETGDLVIWDNRLTQHYASADYGTVPRQVKRVTVVGEVPVSVHGEHSHALQGDATEFNNRFATVN